MACERCQVVPTPVVPEFVLLSTPHGSTRDKVLELLAAGDWPHEVTDVGIKVHCRGKDWGTLAQTLSATMNDPERIDTRVAVVPRSDSPAALYQAMFQARSLKEIVAQLSDSWLYDVLRKDRLAIHFHPLVRHAPGRPAELFAMECLARGLKPDGGIIPPGDLFGAARSLDMLFLLDQKCRLACVRHAARTAADLAAVAPAVNFFINFLPTAIYNPEHCLQTTLAAIRGSNIDPSRITFEVVETEHVGDYEHLVKVLRFYREQGFKVALDDVGAGYSSLLSLSRLRPDYIKIDGEFSRRAAGSAMEGRMLRDLTAACEQNGITTIAEGVETPDQLAFLVDAGVTITQGWIHCRPAATPPAGEPLRQMLDRADQIARVPRPSRAAS